LVVWPITALTSHTMNGAVNGEITSTINQVAQHFVNMCVAGRVSKITATSRWGAAIAERPFYSGKSAAGAPALIRDGPGIYIYVGRGNMSDVYVVSDGSRARRARSQPAT
jgi:hypothetical protein